ncbi:motility associated factor glycosyltransferase family protein [Arsukibacterium indicum]|uniref:DUF115 domain-containing protein n=1 Tax=Arsukibacterium indicum TaxID=2848612 RepID=A0ABS6MHM7_9GAMM|nr:6-hydroxymethylpterin diphosphokinase MptE-like protein [Arsukibacterium indicum]MBV2127879.1 DUF115 domain-containing protein [Arsukibacterium indicum]
MLKYINYQVTEDAHQQQNIEQALSAHIQQQFTSNLQAFKHYMPSVVPLIEQHHVQQYSVFATAAAELNIVDFATGRVWYSEQPQLEVQQEVETFCNAAPYLMVESTTAVGQAWSSEALPVKAEAVLMFGLGFGFQLTELLQNCRVKYLVLYEPDLDVLFCSIQNFDWQALFELAEATGTQLFLQLGNDGQTITEDLAELLPLLHSDRIYIYRHRFHPMLDEVIQSLWQHNGKLHQFAASNQNILPSESFYDYVAERNAGVIGNFPVTATDGDEQQYQRNLQALEKFYPAVFKAIQQHSSRHWQLVTDHQQHINLWHPGRNALFHYDLEQEAAGLVQYFIHHPYKDDVLLGQQSLGKLKHYIHFSHVNQVQPLISQQLEQQSVLTDEVDSLIIFGVGLGRHIELLTEQRKIKNLYICEPNLDFFAASLRVTDWASIIERADQQQCRIYLNLGGDGSTYFYDLMAQFYQVGAYSIANTYMLSSYFNHSMQKSISDLRSELRVVLALGEYFDHARYGVAHTYNSLAKQHKFLKQDSSIYRDLPVLDLPVFIIGNGPSLDNCIDYLKEYRDRVILISCGTALSSLHKQGIKPDFHAEVEQNRSTYYWINQVNAPDYLKDIYLLSVNGIHPDTAQMFKDVLLCFKDGESSTFMFQQGLKKKGQQIASLSYAYPTVSNLVMNFVLRLGSKALYLFGVDLGYIDIRYHHSQSSAYYRPDGSEVYNYQQAHGGGIPAKGNFLPMVFTKREFEVSRKLLEQAIQKAGRKLEIYNCSNGAYISGAVPLQPANILLGNEIVNKPALFNELIKRAFYTPDPTYADDIFNALDLALFSQTIEKWLALFDDEITDSKSAREFVEKQWVLLRSTVKMPADPTFCLLYGSTNYFGGVLTKLASCISPESPKILETFHKVKAIWRDYLVAASNDFIDKPLKFDDVNVENLFKAKAKA